MPLKGLIVQATNSRLSLSFPQLRETPNCSIASLLRSGILYLYFITRDQSYEKLYHNNPTLVNRTLNKMQNRGVVIFRVLCFLIGTTSKAK
jgi:hypothetical protein